MRTYRIRKLDMTVAAALWTLGKWPGDKPRGFYGPSPWQEAKLKELLVLATHLSDDLAEVARVGFGDGQATTAWSRRKQWQVAKGMSGR